MMGDNGGRKFDLISETLRQRTCNVDMDALAPAAQQRGVSGVLHERVFEHIARFRRRAAIGELASDRRPDLRDLPDRLQSIQPRHQRILQGRGNRYRGQLGGESISPVLLKRNWRAGHWFSRLSCSGSMRPLLEGSLV